MALVMPRMASGTVTFGNQASQKAATAVAMSVSEPSRHVAEVVMVIATAKLNTSSRVLWKNAM